MYLSATVHVQYGVDNSLLALFNDENGMKIGENYVHHILLLPTRLDERFNARKYHSWLHFLVNV